MGEPETLLRRLALSDERLIGEILDHATNAELSGLDAKTHALARVAADVALNASAASYQCSVNAAFAAGATDEEVVGVLVAAAPEIGMANVVSLAPTFAAAIGYDVEAAFETGDVTQS